MNLQAASSLRCRRHLGRLILAVGVVVLAMGQVARAEDPPFDLRLLESQPDRIVLELSVRSFDTEALTIAGEPYVQIQLAKESPICVAGAPELPNICRSVIIPDGARMAVTVPDADFYDVKDIAVAPSKGAIFRHTNPDDVPYTFGDAYQADAFYPGELATLRDPYILRDQRGVVVEINPFQYNPVQRLLRVYTRMTVVIEAAGSGDVNVMRRPAVARDPSLAFHKIYANQFINYAPGARYAPLDETGDMLIIAHDAWLGNMQPLVNHKNARGINTTAVGVSAVGNSAASIKAYIQNLFNAGDLAFVLLVGNATHVVAPQVTVGYETESADPTYAQLGGWCWAVARPLRW